MIASTRDEADLEWYYRQADQGAHQSTFGDQLRRQEALYSDSTGRKLAAVEARTWLYIRCHDDRSVDPSYVPEHGTSIRAAVLSRRLRQLHDGEQTILATKYGDIGKEWERILDGRYPYGCLFALTELGRQIVARHRGGLQPQRIIEQVIRAQEGNPVEERGTEIRLMDHAARRMLANALAAFRRTA